MIFLLMGGIVTIHPEILQFRNRIKFVFRHVIQQAVTIKTALIWYFPKKSAQFRFFLPEIRPPQAFLRISPYPQKNAFLRITLAPPGCQAKVASVILISASLIFFPQFPKDFFFIPSPSVCSADV